VSRADFYQLKSTDPASRYPLLCRLLEKAVGAGQQVYIHCQDDAEASHLDQYIWAFKPDSFIAHTTVDAQGQTSVLLGHTKSSASHLPQHNEICINLSQVAAPDSFERIIELVVQEPDMLKTARARYASYTLAGRTMQYHKL